LTLTASLGQLSVKNAAGQEQFGFEQLSVDLSGLSIAQAGWVVDELRLQAPRLTLARLGDGRYDISDLLDTWLAPSEKPTALPRFSINNIQVLDGSLHFDDRPKGTKHTAKAITFKLPFVSSMGYQAEVFVEPHFSAVLDGAHIDLQGRSQPFAASHTSELALQLQGLDLSRLQPYLPASVPVRLKAGALSGDLKLAFSADRDGVYTARLSGDAQLAGLDLQLPSGAPWLGLDKAELALQPSDPLKGLYALGPVALDGLRLGQAQTAPAHRPVAHRASPPGCVCPAAERGQRAGQGRASPHRAHRTGQRGLAHPASGRAHRRESRFRQCCTRLERPAGAPRTGRVQPAF
jgi:hypothetical protein